MLGLCFWLFSTSISDESAHEKSGSSGNKHDLDPGTKSEGEEDSSLAVTAKGKATLGRTPNHLTLSTTSTLSAGSTGSQARLIQSSHQPENYQPPMVKDLGKNLQQPTCMQCYLSGNYKK